MDINKKFAINDDELDNVAGGVEEFTDPDFTLDPPPKAAARGLVYGQIVELTEPSFFCDCGCSRFKITGFYKNADNTDNVCVNCGAGFSFGYSIYDTFCKKQ